MTGKNLFNCIYVEWLYRISINNNDVMKNGWAEVFG